MTEEKFKDGVRSYLKAYQYGNAETKDLWASLTNFADLPENLTISKIMDTWTTQAGYPVVKFDGKTITQERFFLNASGKSMPRGSSKGFGSWFLPRLWLVWQL